MRKSREFTLIELLVVISVFFSLLLAGVAQASYTKITLYLDGVEVNDVNYGDVLSEGVGTLPITIGSVGNIQKNYFYNEYIGAMDEFAIYQGLLDASRIQAHYDANDSNAAYTAAVSADEPLLWLRFEDATVGDGDTAENSGLSITDGEYNVQGGVSPFGLVPGINAGSNALDFPDSGADAAGRAVYVDDNGEFSSGIDGILTVELWAKYILGGASPPPGGDWARFYVSQKAGYGLFKGNTPNNLNILPGTIGVNLPYDINDNTWHHLVVTYESVPEPRIPKDTNSYVEEVNENNPVLWLRFDSSDPCDSSGNGNWVGYGSAASIVDKVGGIGKSVKLDGSDGGNVYGVAATNNPNAPPLVGGTYEVFDNNYAFTPNDITFEIWYKTLPAGQPQPANFGYFFQQHGASGNENVAPAVGRSGGEIRVSGGSGLGYTGVNPKFDGQWHQMVVTYDEDYQGTPDRLYVQLYIDGQLKDVTDFTAAGSKLGPELSHILLGAENDMGNTYNAFAGYMDEFAIYNGILDPNSIEDHYWAWQPKDCLDATDRGYGMAADINKDCKIDFADFASFALSWKQCNDPCDADCSPYPWE